MVVIKDVGEISIFSNGASWIIPNFFDFSQKYGTIIRSPHIRFAEKDWSMQVFTNGSGWFGISVFVGKCDSEFRSLRLGIKGTGRSFAKFRAEHNGKGIYGRKLFPCNFLKSWKDIMVPGGDLHVYFDIEHDANVSSVHAQLIQLARGDVEKWIKEKSENTYKEISTQTEDENEKWCKEKIEKTCVEACTQTEDELGENEFKVNHGDVICQTSTQIGKEIEIGIEDQDFKDIFLNGNISDVVLKIHDKESRAHKCILAAESPAFLAVIMHDTKEEITRVVDFQDFDQNTFPDFLNYLYTGCVENLTSETALKLYAVANKYKINELKENCRNHMLENISIDNFCELFTLSHRHNEEDLKEACIQFFSENSLEIVLTSKWQTLLTENPTAANELFIKHLQLNI